MPCLSIDLHMLYLQNCQGIPNVVEWGGWPKPSRSGGQIAATRSRKQAQFMKYENFIYLSPICYKIWTFSFLGESLLLTGQGQWSTMGPRARRVFITEYRWGHSVTSSCASFNLSEKTGGCGSSCEAATTTRTRWASWSRTPSIATGPTPYPSLARTSSQACSPSRSPSCPRLPSRGRRGSWASMTASVSSSEAT